jgi:hypothetical protein
MPRRDWGFGTNFSRLGSPISVPSRERIDFVNLVIPRHVYVVDNIDEGDPPDRLI